MSSLSELKITLEELLDHRRSLEKDLENAQRQYKIGLWAILLGLPLLLVYGFGLLLIIAGALAAITNTAKKGNLNAQLNGTNTTISELRRKIAAQEGG